MLYIETETSEQLISRTNRLNLEKKWLQYDSNQGIQSMSVINSVYLLASIAMSIDSAGTTRCIIVDSGMW